MAQMVTSTGRQHSHKKPFHERLAEERKRRNLSPTNLAKFAMVQKSEYDGWEEGRGLPTIEQFTRMFGRNNHLFHALEAAHTAAADAPKSETKPTGVGSSVAIDTTTIVTEARSALGAGDADTVAKEGNGEGGKGEGEVEVVGKEKGPVAASWFGPLLKKAREDAGLSKAGLAVQVGISAESITAWETAKSLPSRHSYSALTKALPALASHPAPEGMSKARGGRPPTNPKHPKNASKHNAPAKQRRNRAPRNDVQSSAVSTTPADTLAALDLVADAFIQTGTIVRLASERVGAEWCVRLIDEKSEAPVAQGSGKTLPLAARAALLSAKSTLHATAATLRDQITTMSATLAAQEAAFAAVSNIVDSTTL